MTLVEIDYAAQAVGILQARIKARAMTYQADLKDRVAAELGVLPGSLDLPYSEWAEIRDDFLKRQSS